MGWSLWGNGGGRNQPQGRQAPAPQQAQNPIVASFFRGPFVVPNWMMMGAAALSGYLQLQLAGAENPGFMFRFAVAGIPLLLAFAALHFGWAAYKMKDPDQQSNSDEPR